MQSNTFDFQSGLVHSYEYEVFNIEKRSAGFVTETGLTDP